jgi:molybdate transport system regulatory protein
MKKTTHAGKHILPRYRVYCGKDLVLGPGKAELLEHIAETGSISEAARRMRMSYNRAWLHAKAMNDGFRERLVFSSRGGRAGGGAALTAMGRRVLKLYRQIEQEAAIATKSSCVELAKLLKA